VESVEEGLGGSSRLATLDGLLAKLLLGVGSGIGVEAEHDLLVAQRVLLLDVDALGAGLALGSAENGLDFGRVDQAGQIGVGNQVGRQEVVLLESRGAGGGAVDLVKGLEGGGGPDDEAAEVTTGGELEEVEGEDGGGLNTGDVAEGLDEVLAVGLGVVDNEGTAALAEAAVTELTLTSADLAGLLDLDEIGTSTDSLEEGDSGLGLGQGSTLEDLGVNDEGNLGDVGDTVTAGEEQSGGRRSSQSGGGSETTLANVDLLVPLAPDLGRGEHTTGTALVTEGSLTGTVSTTTGDTGDTGDSTTYSIERGFVSCLFLPIGEMVKIRWFCKFLRNLESDSSNLEKCAKSRTGTPGLSGGLFTSLLAHGVGLALVLGHTDVNLPVEKIISISPPFVNPSISSHTGQYPGG